MRQTIVIPIPTATGNPGTPRAQITRAITDAIRSGRAARTTALPSQREIAATFGVSEATVNRALVDLREEGWVDSRRDGPHGGWVVMGVPVTPTVYQAVVSVRGEPTRALVVTGFVSAARARRWAINRADRFVLHAVAPTVHVDAVDSTDLAQLNRESPTLWGPAR